MLDIHETMTGLATRGSIINSRSEFHHTLFDYLCEIFPNNEVVSEIHPLSFGKTKFIIGIPSREVAIRLWCPKAGKRRDNLTRYELLRDVDRMERAVGEVNWLKHGIVLMLTDMNKLWEVPRSESRGAHDASFRIHHGAMLNGILSWAEHTSLGIKRGREQPIQLCDHYFMDWRNCSIGSDEQYTTFRYLAVEVGK